MIPVGQWGPQEVLPPYTKKPAPVPAQDVHLKAGDPVDLSDLVAQAAQRRVVQQATDRIMAALTALVGGLRGETGARRSGSTRARPGSSEIGNPKKKDGISMSKVAVFGAGSWGTAFSMVLADAGNDVTLWGRREEVCATINEQRENTDYLPGIELPPAISATHDPEKARARRRRDGARGAVADAPREPRRVGAVHPERRGDGVADEGRRARHHSSG